MSTQENSITNCKQPVRPSVQSFNTLLNQQDMPLALDSYQRGFVWDTEKIQQLIDDLQKHQKAGKQDHPYYMGTILLHHSAQERKRYIIDGQQRLTALCLLHHSLNGQLPSGIAMTYSGQSERCVLQAHQYLNGLSSLPEATIFQQLCFTVITVSSADLAFTFFGTENHRGVPLRTTDLLKAYHLRSVQQNSQTEALQRDCAKRWESLPITPKFMHESDNKDNVAPDLFNKILWRARRWQGGLAPWASRKQLQNEFEKKSWVLENHQASANTVPVFPSHSNQPDYAMQWQEQIANKVTVKETYTHQARLNPSDYPMALRQPIYKGLSFFLYADKYAHLLQKLGDENSSSQEIKAFNEIDNQLLLANQFYLREIFWLASLMYLDQFGEKKLETFALYLEYILGAIRLEQGRVVKETAANFFRYRQQNLLDVIVQSYHPDQVLGYLRQQQPRYAKNYEENPEKPYAGVRKNYKFAVLDYFCIDPSSKTANLAKKWQWVLKKTEEKSQ